MAIKAFLFDAGDVLYHKPARAPALRAFIAERGGSDPQQPDRVKALKREAFAGEMSEEQYHRELLAHYGIADEAAVRDGIGLLTDLQRRVEFFDGVAETLMSLKQVGFKLGVVTNTFNSRNEKLEWFGRIGIADIWDSYANSCDLKVVKPDPGIYLAAIAPLGIAANEAAFVGHSQSELFGAKALGMVTIRFNPDPDCVTADYLAEQFSDLIDISRRLGT